MTVSITAGSSKTEAFKCQSCPSAYMTQSGLDFHTEKQHASLDDIKEFDNKAKEDPTANKPKQKVSDFKCTKCSMLYLSKAGLDKHIDKEHKDTAASKTEEKTEVVEIKETVITNPRKKKRSSVDEPIQIDHKKSDEKSAAKEDAKELKVNETIIGFKSSKTPSNKTETSTRSKKMTRNEIKAKMSKNKGTDEGDVEEVDNKPVKETRSRTRKESNKKNPKEDNEIEEMEVNEVKKKPTRSEQKKAATKKQNFKNQKSGRPTGFNCKKCDVQFITLGGLDAHNKKKHEEKEKEKKQKPKPPKEEKVQHPDDGGVIWPPETGTIVATLFEDDFYLGKVLKVSGKKTVKVQYMDRYKKAPKDTKDQYWIMPEKPDPPVQTDRESILGVNAIIEKDEKYSSKQMTVYVLTNHQTWTRLGKSSRIGL